MSGPYEQRWEVFDMKVGSGPSREKGSVPGFNPYFTV